MSLHTGTLYNHYRQRSNLAICGEITMLSKVHVKYIQWVFIGPIFRLITSSAAVAYPHRGLMCCVCSEMLFCIPLLYMRGYLLCRHHPVSFLPVWPFSSDLCFCPRNYHSLDVFCIFAIPGDGSFWDTQTTLSGTNNHSMVKVTFLSHSDIWCVCAFMHLVAATWLADEIFALTSWCTALP